MSVMIQSLNAVTVILCVILKFPQIRRVQLSKSYQGLSLNSIVLELWGYTTILTYSWYQEYKFMLYAEYFFLVIQDVILLFMVLTLMNLLNVQTTLLIATSSIIQINLALGYLPNKLINLMILACVPISASSKILQLTSILQTECSDQVSVASWTMAAITSASRILTTILGTQDIVILINLIVSLVLNVMVIGAALFYQKPSSLKNKYK